MKLLRRPRRLSVHISKGFIRSWVKEPIQRVTIITILIVMFALFLEMHYKQQSSNVNCLNGLVNYDRT